MKKINREKFIPILFILPSIILVFIFVYGFIGWTGIVSLINRRDIFPNFSFVGFKIYKKLFSGL